LSVAMLFVALWLMAMVLVLALFVIRHDWLLKFKNL